MTIYISEMADNRLWTRERVWGRNGSDPVWGLGITPSQVHFELDKIGDEFQYWYPDRRVTNFSLHKNLVRFLDWSTGSLFKFREHGFDFCGDDWHITDEDEAFESDVVVIDYKYEGRYDSFIAIGYLTPAFQGATWDKYWELRRSGTAMMDAYRLCVS
jgi:hypothetical protein